MDKYIIRLKDGSKQEVEATDYQLEGKAWIFYVDTSKVFTVAADEVKSISRADVAEPTSNFFGFA